MNEIRKYLWIIVLGSLLASCSSSSEKVTQLEEKEDTSSILNTENLVQQKNEADSTDVTPSEKGYNGFIISGQLTSFNSGLVFLEKNKENRLVKVASSEIGANGNFEIRAQDLTKNYVYLLTMPSKQQVFLYLDNDRIQVKERKGDFIISGSDESVYYNGYMQIAVKYNAEMSVLNKSYQHYFQSGQRDKAKELEKEFKSLESKRNEELKSYLKATPASMTLMNGLIEFTTDIDTHAEFIRAAVRKLEKSDKNLRNKGEFLKQIKSKLAIAIGEIAPDFELPTAEGEKIKLSSLRGKYVLIDFWASWCGPCRGENPNVLRVYNKYKDKGFEILGVSLDKDRARWLGAIQKDGLTWKHVSDLKFWQSEAARLYGVTGIPFTVLLDPKGKIIAKNLRGVSLEKKLSSVL